MLNALYVIIMDMLPPTVKEDYFDLKQIATSHEVHNILGTPVSLRYISLLAAYLVAKLLIAIGGI